MMDVDDVVRRLAAAERADYEQVWNIAKEYGREWAEGSARPAELRRVARTPTERGEERAEAAWVGLMRHLPTASDEMVFAAISEQVRAEGLYLEMEAVLGGFLEGATAVWTVVAPHLSGVRPGEQKIGT